MSAALQVKLSKPVHLEKLRHLAELTLQELLDLSFAPVLQVQELKSGVSRPISTGVLNHKGQVLIYKLEDRDESVAITVIEIPSVPQVSVAEAGLWADISVGGTQSPLEYALAAIIAIALAREVSTFIADDALLWARELESSPDDFAHELRVRGQNNDMSAAAEIMYSRMPIRQGNKSTD